MALTNFPSQTYPACSSDASTCQVHGDQLESMSRTHAAEVLTLRRRIAALEHALAVAETSVSSISSLPVSHGNTPAVAAADLPGQGAPPGARAAQSESHADVSAAGNPQLVSAPTLTGAEAWDDGEATFTERMAARAFFREEAADDSARRWFLRND